jgi:hypothetical protein
MVCPFAIYISSYVLFQKKIDAPIACLVLWNAFSIHVLDIHIMLTIFAGTKIVVENLIVIQLPPLAQLVHFNESFVDPIKYCRCLGS